jgi:hypothetical protein
MFLLGEGKKVTHTQPTPLVEVFLPFHILRNRQGRTVIHNKQTNCIRRVEFSTVRRKVHI